MALEHRHLKNIFFNLMECYKANVRIVKYLPVTRCTGASKWKNVSCSIIRAQISDPTPEKEN